MSRVKIDLQKCSVDQMAGQILTILRTNERERPPAGYFGGSLESILQFELAPKALGRNVTETGVLVMNGAYQAYGGERGPEWLRRKYFDAVNKLRTRGLIYDDPDQSSPEFVVLSEEGRSVPVDPVTMAIGTTETPAVASENPVQQPGVTDPLTEYQTAEWFVRKVPVAKPADRSVAPASVDIVLMTANEIERDAALKFLTPLPGQTTVLRVHHRGETYFVGQFGAHTTALTMCAMGAVGRDAAILASATAIAAWLPRALIMVGLALGKDDKKQQIADVLVADRIVPYEPQRVGETSVNRAPIPPVGRVLLNRFRNVQGWQFVRPDGRPVTLKIGALLSGEKLIDDKEFKDQLFGRFPEGIGGEMEGAGVFAAAAREGVEWILVKAICDWADGHKDDRYQPLAAAAAVSLVHHVLLAADALIDIRPAR